MTATGKAKGFAAGIVAAVCYGTNPLGTLRLYEEGFSSSSVLVYRYLLAVVMFAAVMALRGEKFAIRPGHAIRMAVLGAMFALSSATLYVSFRYMAAGIASTLLFVYPIMTAVLMAAFFHEKITRATATAILLAVSGVGLLYRGDGDTSLSTAGFALVMCSSLLYALYIISVNRWSGGGMSSVKFTFWILVFSLLTLLAFSFVAGEPIQMLSTPRQWMYALQLALLPTVLSIFLINISISLVGSTSAAIMGALEPVTAVVIGVTVFGESISAQLCVGIAAILAGVSLVVGRSGKGKEKGANTNQ